MDATKKGDTMTVGMFQNLWGVQFVSQGEGRGRLGFYSCQNLVGQFPAPPGSDGLEDETVVCGVIPKFPFVGIILSTMFPPTKRSYVCWPPSKFTKLRFETISSGGNVVTVQLRGNSKDINFQLHHRLSKFEVPAVVNLKHIFELFGLYTTCFLI